MAKKVKCQDCGFLCDRDDLIKLSDEFKKIIGNGVIIKNEPPYFKKIRVTVRDILFDAYKNQVKSEGKNGIQDLDSSDKFFWCFKEVTDLKKFFPARPIFYWLGEMMMSKDISEPRKCKDFFPRRKGLSPEDHIRLEIEEKRFKRTNIIAIVALLFSLLAILWNIYTYLK